ncbi:hypothetical protein ACQEU3_39235 [Spirillospora sp. CA-253888]
MTRTDLPTASPSSRRRWPSPPRSSPLRSVWPEAWSIELNIGNDDPLESVMLHVRGGGDDVLAVVLRIAQSLGCRALDISTGEFLAEGQAEGWHTFRQYRDRMAGQPDAVL